MRVPGIGDVVRVRPGTEVPGHGDMSTVNLTVVDTHTLVCVELEATESTGGEHLHLLASQVDILTPPRGES